MLNFADRVGKCPVNQGFGLFGRAAALGLLASAGGVASAIDVLPDVPMGELTVRLDVVATGLDEWVGGTLQHYPTDMTPLPDGRFLVMTLGGVVRVFHPETGLQAQPWLDVWNEDSTVHPNFYGMTSIVSHPGYGDPSSPGYGKVYLIETEVVGDVPPDFDGSLQQFATGGPHHEVIAEYTATDPSADVFSGTRREVMRVEQPGWDHNVWDLMFGVGDESHLMYITSGDGVYAGVGDALIRQNPQTLANIFGKVLRIDPLGTGSANGEYGVPGSNPFVGVIGAVPEIYTYGHRSPFRLTADPVTGDLWLGEVGQVNVEEINRLEAGGNYGWALKEGSFLFNQLIHDGLTFDEDLDGNGNGDFADSHGYIDPVFEYDHGSGVCTIGGYVYRGERWPLLEGKYVFGDWVRGGQLQGGLWYGESDAESVSGQLGAIRELRVDPDGSPMPNTLLGFGEGLDGELYLVGRLGGDGVVMRMSNPCPVDLASPAGVLDLADVSAFVGAFMGGSLAADLAAPLGVLDLSDLSAFVIGFGDGCP